MRWQRKWNKTTKLTAGLQAMTQDNANALNASDTLIPNAQSVDVGGYVSVNHEHKKWNLQAGIRYDRRTIFAMLKCLPN
jgi:outer membrane cobalamin receptor